MEPFENKRVVDRREFLRKFLAGLIGGSLMILPLGAGLAVFLDPLRHKTSAGKLVRITTLDSLPADGVPRKFPVMSTKVDAWNKSPLARVGAVYLRRLPDGKTEALNVVCPHAGCFVDFLPERGAFLCPCHNSLFSLTGQIQDRSSPAPRGMDALEVQITNEKEVWVKFQNFQAGTNRQIPVT
jgi:menaquinol-cytochrome c reductase iron-sulfur subunit